MDGRSGGGGLLLRRLLSGPDDDSDGHVSVIRGAKADCYAGFHPELAFHFGFGLDEERTSFRRLPHERPDYHYMALGDLHYTAGKELIGGLSRRRLFLRPSRQRTHRQQGVNQKTAREPHL